MSNDEIAGRLHVLEHFVMAALGLYLADGREDPDYTRATALLDHLRGSAVASSVHLPLGAQQATQDYADHLVDFLIRGVRTLRGEGGQTH
jgi:hypothetical protein